MRHSERRGEGNFWQSAEQIALCPFYGLFLFFGPFSSGQVNYHLGTDKGLGRRRRRRLCLDPISQDPHSSLNCCYLGYVRPVQPSPFPLGSSPTVMIINEAGQRSGRTRWKKCKDWWLLGRCVVSSRAPLPESLTIASQFPVTIKYRFFMSFHNSTIYKISHNTTTHFIAHWLNVSEETNSQAFPGLALIKIQLWVR